MVALTIEIIKVDFASDWRGRMIEKIRAAMSVERTT
jgi:hypothetical protein